LVVDVELAEQRDVHDGGVDVARRVLVELLRPAQVDDADDAVGGERPPAFLAQLPDVVRADEGAVAGAPTVRERHAAEVPNVQAPVPLECPRHAADGSAPRYASITAGFRCTSSGVPSAILWPKSST